MTTTKDEIQEKPKSKEPKQLKEKPQLPPVSFLLQHGAQDPDAEPETFLQSLVMPGLLLLTFVVSLALFHWATDGFAAGGHHSRRKGGYFDL